MSEQSVTAYEGVGTVDAFYEPEPALSEYKANHYQGIVLDIRMPGMSGFELARAIWEKDPDARICFMTAFEIYNEEAKKVFPNLKQHCFLKKPIPAKALAEHLQNHVVTSRNQSLTGMN